MTATDIANLLIDRNPRLCKDRVLSRQLAADTLFPVLPESGDLKELGKNPREIRHELEHRVEASEPMMSAIALSLLLILIEVLIKWWLANRKTATAALRGLRA